MTDFKTSDRDVNRAIRSWLREDRHEDASRIAGAVLDQVEATPERRATWWPARRTTTMNKIVGFGLAAAAVVAVVLIGSQLIGSPANTGSGGATPTPQPTASPSARSTQEPTPEAYVLSLPGDPVAVSVTVPAAGWSADPGGGVLVSENSVDSPGGAGIITFVEDDGYRVYGDPCQWSTTRPDSPSTTVDELVDALSAQASRDASAPVDVTLDGYAGKSITLHVPDDADFAQCDEGLFGSWGTRNEDPSRYHQGAGQIDKLWIVDVDGHLVVIDAGFYAGTPQDVVDELDAIVESATFGE